MFNETQITKENMHVVLETLGKAKWVTRNEARFLREVFETILVTHFGDNHPDYVRSLVFTPYSDTIADKMAWGLGYPYSGDVEYDYYGSGKWYPVFLGIGKVMKLVDIITLWVKNATVKVVEYLRRKEFYVYDLTLKELKGHSLIKDYLIENYFDFDDSCLYEQEEDEEDEGPYGGAFRDWDDYYTWKNGAGFVSSF